MTKGKHGGHSAHQNADEKSSSAPVDADRCLSVQTQGRYWQHDNRNLTRHASIHTIYLYRYTARKRETGPCALINPTPFILCSSAFPNTKAIREPNNCISSLTSCWVFCKPIIPLFTEDSLSLKSLYFWRPSERILLGPFFLEKRLSRSRLSKLEYCTYRYDTWWNRGHSMRFKLSLEDKMNYMFDPPPYFLKNWMVHVQPKIKRKRKTLFLKGECKPFRKLMGFSLSLSFYFLKRCITFYIK